jgi:hypothetical protein
MHFRVVIPSKSTPARPGTPSVRFIRAAGLSSVGTIALGGDADNRRIDRTSERVLVGDGDGGFAIIEPAMRSKLEDIELPGHREGCHIDPIGDRIYLKVPDAHSSPLSL